MDEKIGFCFFFAILILNVNASNRASGDRSLHYQGDETRPSDENYFNENDFRGNRISNEVTVLKRDVDGNRAPKGFGKIKEDSYPLSYELLQNTAEAKQEYEDRKAYIPCTEKPPNIFEQYKDLANPF